MAWIDYKKACDMVPHSWIIECLDLFGVAENIKSLLVNSMEKWKVMLCSGNSELEEVEIERGIFQGDSSVSSRVGTPFLREPPPPPFWIPPSF